MADSDPLTQVVHVRFSDSDVEKIEVELARIKAQHPGLNITKGEIVRTCVLAHLTDKSRPAARR